MAARNGASSVAEMSGGGRAFKVLVVDDSAMSRSKLAAAVRHLGHSVEQASGGAAGLAAMASGDIDLVLLDILMPEVDGYEVLRQRNADPALVEIPVLVISSLDDTREVVDAIELGAIDFLPKDVDPLLFRARVSSCLEKKRLRDLELDYLEDVRLLAESARIVRETDFNPARLPLERVVDRSDSLGDLARVFTHMASEVHRREMAYRRQIDLLRGGFLLILIGVMTGLYPALSKMLAGTSVDNPLGMAAWVALVATVVGLVGSVLTGGGLPQFSWRKVRFAMIIGPFAGCVPHFAFFLASEHLSAIVMSIIVALASLIVYLTAIAIGLEKANIVRLGGILMGLVAVVLVLQTSSEGLQGIALVWIAVALLVPFSAALEGILMLALPSEETGAFELVFLTMLGSTVWAWSVSGMLGTTLPLALLDQTTILLLLAVALISGIGTWLFALALKKTGALFASQYTYVSTIMGVIWSIVLLSEQTSGWVWAALACMLVGMAMVRPKESEEIVRPQRATRPKDLDGMEPAVAVIGAEQASRSGLGNTANERQ